MSRHCAVSILGLAFLLTSLGCERGPEPLVAVSGQVSYGGKPLPTGTVAFTPDPQRGGTGQAVHAEIQKDGSYRLRTGGLDGVAAGWYRVTVLAVEQPLVELPKDSFLIPRSLIPEKYRDPEQSGLTREVKSGKECRIDLDLE